MSAKIWTSTVILIVLCSQKTDGISVMGIFSVPLKSHYMAFKPLFEELVQRGHKVTVMGNFPNSEPVVNFKDVDISSPDEASAKVLPLSDYEELPKSLHNAYNFWRHVYLSPKMTPLDCGNLFTNMNVKALIESGEKFDVIIIEQFISDCALPFTAAFYKGVPLIGITSHVLLPWTYSKFGLPFRLPSDAFYFSPGGQTPTTLQKLESMLLGFYFNVIAKRHIQGIIKSVVDEHVPNNAIIVEDVARDMRMIFAYQHFSLTGARLLAPQVLEIGGLHIGKPKPLPTEIENFVRNSKHGVVYVSFGSMIHPSSMSEAKIQAFLDAFDSIPQNILWKFDNVTILEGRDSRKMMAQTWLPQLDILCDQNVIGFVSHGGMLGTSEAISCGVPVVAVPFFGDQFANSASIRDSGLGVQLFYQDITRDTLLEALTDITSIQRRSRAELLSKLWHDRPQSPMDAAIFWTEYVARYGHDQHSPPELTSKRVPLFQELLIDVYLLLAGLLLALLGTVYFLVKFLKYLVVKLARTVMCKSKLE